MEKLPTKHWASSLSDEQAKLILQETAKDNPLLPLIEYLTEHVHLLQMKIDLRHDGVCACDIDRPGDMCAKHWKERNPI